jgi:hypothetical protein
MAESHPIRGIDNSCAAVREAVRRAKEKGTAFLRGPTKPIRGIDNSTPVSHASVRSQGRTAEPAFLIRGIGNGGPAVIPANVVRPGRASEVGEANRVEERLRSAAE